MVSVPYVPVTDVPLLLYALPEETAEFDPPSFLICVTVSDDESSASVSSFNTSSSDPVFVIVASSLTASVSFTATGVSLSPVTVIVRVAVSVAEPSDRVYVNTSFSVSPASNASAAD